MKKRARPARWSSVIPTAARGGHRAVAAQPRYPIQNPRAPLPLGLRTRKSSYGLVSSGVVAHLSTGRYPHGHLPSALPASAIRSALWLTQLRAARWRQGIRFLKLDGVIAYPQIGSYRLKHRFGLLHSNPECSSNRFDVVKITLRQPFFVGVKTSREAVSPDSLEKTGIVSVVQECAGTIHDRQTVEQSRHGNGMDVCGQCGMCPGRRPSCAVSLIEIAVETIQQAQTAQDRRNRQHYGMGPSL